MAWVTWLEVLSYTGGHYPTMSVMNKNLHLLKRISCIVIAPFVFFSTWAKKKTASPNNDQHCLSHKTHCQNIWKDCGVLHWHNSSQNPISTYKQSVFLPTWPNGPPCGQKWMDKCARCCDNAPLWRVPHGQETRPCQIRQYDSMLHKKLHQWLLAGWQ